ncbi:MAG TPA: DUF3108 domain-containing protein, partial [Terriglobia bacterium]|nr:DUF3108 domain-containing protein [Terriglobia bacterium]
MNVQLNRVPSSLVNLGGLALAVSMLAPPLLFGQTKSAPFQPGERLTYDVSWSVFQAGTVTATFQRTLDGTREKFTVDTTARSQGFVSLLFPVDNEFRSVLN